MVIECESLAELVGVLAVVGRGYWSLLFSRDLFKPAKTANTSTRIDITIPNISFIRAKGGAPIQPVDWVQLHALFMRIYAAYHLLIRKR